MALLKFHSHYVCETGELDMSQRWQNGWTFMEWEKSAGECRPSDWHSFTFCRHFFTRQKYDHWKKPKSIYFDQHVQRSSQKRFLPWLVVAIIFWHRFKTYFWLSVGHLFPTLFYIALPSLRRSNNSFRKYLFSFRFFARPANDSIDIWNRKHFTWIHFHTSTMLSIFVVFITFNVYIKKCWQLCRGKNESNFFFIYLFELNFHFEFQSDFFVRWTWCHALSLTQLPSVVFDCRLSISLFFFSSLFWIAFVLSRAFAFSVFARKISYDILIKKF